MATIETKYSIGDVVYFASTVTERKRHPCPDCLGTKAWKATSPAGGEYEFPCPRCAASYNSDRDMMLDYTAHVPCVSRLIIGSIQFNTAKGSYDEGARYMCIETGVGGGSVYEEERLFTSEDEARRAAQAIADAANTTVEWIVKLYDKSLRISDYQLDNAALRLAKDEKSRVHSLLWNLGDLFGKIEEAGDKEEILEAVQDYKTYDWQRDKDRALSEDRP